MVALALLPTLAVLTSTSRLCETLSTTDALLLIDAQNCFMEERTLSGTPQYELSDEEAPNGTIPRGALQVTGSSEIVDVLNDWLELRSSYLDRATVIGTLDYHPPRHCSFCSAHAGGINPFNDDGTVAFCLRGAQTVDNFNETHRCTDSISVEDFANNAYFQWAPHCLAGSFGGRFDPMLRIPEDALVFKLGVQVMEDVYSAFSGGRLSVAASGAHDTVGSSFESLAPANDTLLSQLQQRGVRRLFVMGLATDYTVGATIKNALGIDMDDSDFMLPDSQVILVNAGSKAIIEENAETLRSIIEARSGANPSGKVVYTTSAAGAMAELCTGTCDSKADCGSPDLYCEPLLNFDWGSCVPCKFISSTGGVCSGHGSCAEDGACMCDFGYAGNFCDSNQVLIIVVSAGVLGGMLLVALLAIVVFTVRRRGQRVGALLRSTHLPPELSLEPGIQFHLFLSHIWSTGQDQVAVIKRRMSALLPGVNVFLDVDDLESTAQLEQYIAMSAVVLIFLSSGYFLSKNALREVRAAQKLSKPLVLVHEEDADKGGASLTALQSECPEDARSFVFAQMPPVPWLRLGHFQLESLKLICEGLLLHSPKYRKERERSGRLPLLVPGEISSEKMCCERFTLIYASPDNPGAAALGMEMCNEIAGLKLTEDISQSGMLDYIPAGQASFARHSISGSPAVNSANTPRRVRPRQSDQELVVESYGAVADMQRLRRARRRATLVSRVMTTHRSRRVLVRPMDMVQEESSTSSSTPLDPRSLRDGSPAHARSDAQDMGESQLASTREQRTRTAEQPSTTASCRAARDPVPSSLPNWIAQMAGAVVDQVSPPSSSDRPTHMLLYLNDETWMDSAGDRLAFEVRAARAAGIPIVMAHEKELERGACPFARFFAVTPEDLVRQGLYAKTLAVPWLPGSHRLVSQALMAKSLGAVPAKTVNKTSSVVGRVVRVRSGSSSKTASVFAPEVGGLHQNHSEAGSDTGTTPA